MSTALAVVDASDQWSKERVDLIKRTICPTGITDAELALFIEQCKRSGLDPIKGEIFCVPRSTNIGSKNAPKWITKHVPQPAEAGLSARADRFPDFRGIKAAAFYDGDEIRVTENGVTHSFNPAKRGTVLLGAWAQAFREGRVLPVEMVKFSDYSQDTAQWRGKAETMIVKCARAAALRRAYPNAFGGLYLREEMPAEEFDGSKQSVAMPALNGPDTVRAALSAPAPVVTKLVAKPPLIVDVKAGETEDAASARAKAAMASAGIKLEPEALKSEFSGLEEGELAAKHAELEKWIQDHPGAQKMTQAQAKLAAIAAEMALRIREMEGRE